MFLHTALQDFKQQADYVQYWTDQIHKFLKSQHYTVEDYNKFCTEASVTWPTDKLLSLVNLANYTVRKLSFAPVYYAFCLKTNDFKVLDDTKAMVEDKLVSCSFSAPVVRYYDQSEITPGIMFLKDEEDILWYFFRIVSLGSFVFYILAEYWQMFQDINQKHIDLFAAHRKHQDKSIHRSPDNKIVYFFTTTFKSSEPHITTLTSEESILENISMCKLLKDCLEWSKHRLKTYVQKYYLSSY